MMYQSQRCRTPPCRWKIGKQSTAEIGSRFAELTLKYANVPEADIEG